jgi:hypothetical protein
MCNSKTCLSQKETVNYDDVVAFVKGGGKEEMKLLHNFHLTRVKENFFLLLRAVVFKKNKHNKVLYLPIERGKQYAKQ